MNWLIHHRAVMLVHIIGLVACRELNAQDFQKPLHGPDSVAVFSPERNYWLPAAEVLGVNLGVWSYNRYLTKEGWSDIGWNTVKQNFRTGFVWDYDGYLTNQFMHPYHGSLYFSAARTSGLGFWESAPYTFGGSLVWEYFMEDEPPSYNDIVNTPVTGILLGEISFRVSNIIIDESTGGCERILRETCAFAINPVHGFKRLLRGEIWKSGSAREHKTILLQMSLGVNNIFYSRKLVNNSTYALLGFDLTYGEQVNVAQHRDPFDYFTLHTEVSFTRDDNIVGIFASGVLWDTKIHSLGRSKNVLGAYKEVDILINAVYKLSATSIAGQLINIQDISPTARVRSSLSLAAILMGATNSHYSIEYGKDYNIGPGASAQVSSTLLVDKYGSVHLSYKRYWIHTLSGAAGDEFVGLLRIATTCHLTSSLHLGMDFVLYERFGDYDSFPDTQTANSALRFYAQQIL